MKKKQCWEVMDCCKHLDDEDTCNFSICPAASASEYDGVNGGENGGRFCWAVMGTFGSSDPTCSYSSKINDCLSCEFLKQVELEEGSNFILTPQHAIALKELKQKS